MKDQQTLALGDQPWHNILEGLDISAIRIPHAGWPGRADVENIVFRFSFNELGTVMHSYQVKKRFAYSARIKRLIPIPLIK